jgi:hypothetical protein
MVRTLFSVALGLALAGPAVAQPKDKPARGPAPVIATVHLDGNGRPIIARVRTVPQQRIELVQEKVGNVVVQRQVARTVMVYVTEHVVLDNVQILDGTGKRLDPGQARRLIKGETPVLMSADGKAIDPFYLRALREDTVILVAPGGAQGVVAPPPPAGTDPVVVPGPPPLPPPPPVRK